MAALKDSMEVAQLLLDNGAMVEIADRNGRTALHLAAKSDSIRVSKTLVEFGASIDSTDKGGRFPLHIATGTDRIYIVPLAILHMYQEILLLLT